MELLQSDQPLGWRFRMRIACECASALKYLHGLNLIHRDVKSSNILLDHNWTCKLSDFGMAREYSSDETNSARRMTICGTNEYMSPELLFDEEYSNSVDVFSFGMVLLEIMKRVQVGKRGNSSFAARHPQNGFELDFDAVQEALPSDAPPSLVMLALQCCEYDAANRPFSDDVYDWLIDLLETYAPEGPDEIPVMPPCPDELRELEPGTPSKEDDSAPKSQDLTLHSLVEIQSPDTILKAGHIHKKNRHGFRNWKDRFLVLTPYQIRWYVSAKDLVCEKGHIDLTNARVGKTKHHRFVVLDPTEEYKPDNPNAVYRREFAADGEDAMIDWITAIQNAIDNLKAIEDKKTLTDSNSKAKQINEDFKQFDINFHSSKDSMTPDIVMANAHNGTGSATVEMWLDSLNLSQYASIFSNHGYNNLRHISEFGLHTDDFAYMGITHPLHRRVLRVAAVSEYTNTVRAAVTEWQDIGSVVVYKVVSRWRFNRSCVYLKYSEVKKMHGMILSSLKKPECSKVRSKLPTLPDNSEKLIQTRSATFCNQRRQALEVYLLELIGLLSGTPVMKIVLETIGLLPKTLQQKMGSKDKNGNVKRVDSLAHLI